MASTPLHIPSLQTTYSTPFVAGGQRETESFYS